MELPEPSKPKGKSSKKQNLIIVGTLALVVLAFLQLRKMSNSTRTTPATAPAATYTGSSADGTSTGGTGGVTGSDNSASTTQTLLSTFQDSINGVLAGFTTQQQNQQAQIESELAGFADTQQHTIQQYGDLASSVTGDLNSITSKISDLTSQIAHLAPQTSIASPQNISVAPTPSGANTPSTAGPGKTSVTSVFTEVINSGDWNKVSKDTGLSLTQLRSGIVQVNGKTITSLQGLKAGDKVTVTQTK